MSRVLRAAEMALSSDEIASLASVAGVAGVVTLDGYENSVFRSVEPPGLILRVTHTSRRSESQIRAEATFLEKLGVEGVGVAAPHALGDRDVIFGAEVSSGHVVVLTTRFAEGKAPSAATMTPEAIAAYGRTLGGLHRVSRAMPRSDRLDRPVWDDQSDKVLALDLGDADPVALQVARSALQAARSVSPPDRHILIHEDAHLGNLFVTEDDRITLFDFDDCGYGDEAYDVAMVLFYWVAARRLTDLGGEIRRMWSPFVAGYLDECDGPLPSPDLIDHYLKLREVELYALLHDASLTDGWDAAFMEDRRSRIHDGTPYLDRPFGEVLG